MPELICLKEMIGLLLFLMFCFFVVDSNQVIEPCNEELFGPGFATPGISVANLPPCVVEGNVGDCGISGSSVTTQNEEPQVNGKVIPISHDNGASPCDKWGRTGETTNLSVRDVDAAISHIDASTKKANDYPYFEKGTYQICAEDLKGEAPRIRPRSSSPEPRLNDGSKRRAVICDFFAKGWCIKGNSCRFLHIKDQVAITSHHKEGTVDTAASSIQFIPHGGESPRVKSEMQESSLLKDDPLVPSSEDFGREINRVDYRGYSSPMAKGSSLHGPFTNSYARISETYGSKIGTPHMASLEELTCTRSKFLANDHNIPVSVSSLHKSPLSFTYRSRNTDSLSTQKLLDSGQEDHASRSASVQRSSSPLSGSDSENVSRTNAFNDKQYSAGSKTKIPYDWEPSVPFRPSFFITQRLLSSTSLYDPIRDSIEQTSSVVGHTKISHSGKEASVIKAHMQADADSFPTGTLGTECSSNKNLVPFSTKSFPGKDLSKAEEKEMVGAQWQNRKSLLKQERLLDSECVRDVTEADKMPIDCDSKLESSGRHRLESKEERARQKIEADADLKVEESRALKNFHSSLVEVVKELLKPSWHKGVLSKDAHKIIVKKAVEKVLSTLQPHQVPSTSESVKQYLSSSQTKLAKLVEGYVDKYRKSSLG